MKKLGGFLIVLSFSIILSACPPLEEDDPDNIYGNIITFDEPLELDVYKWFEILDTIAKENTLTLIFQNAPTNQATQKAV